MSSLRRRSCTVLSMALCACLAGGATADPATFGFSSGVRAAEATFAVVEGDLQVTLTNTSAQDVLEPKNVLTALFFDLPSVGALTPVSALLNSGSVVLFGPDGGGNVGGEWAYRGSVSGAPLGATEGIGSAGLGIFGNPNFNGPNLEGPAAVNGGNYGITSAGDDSATGNAEVTGNVPLIRNSVVFTLGDIPASFDPSATDAITHVWFQYGTALDDGGGGGGGPVPEAPSLALLAFGAIPLALAAIRRRR